MSYDEIKNLIAYAGTVGCMVGSWLVALAIALVALMP